MATLVIDETKVRFCATRQGLAAVVGLIQAARMVGQYREIKPGFGGGQVGVAFATPEQARERMADLAELGVPRSAMRVRV